MKKLVLLALAGIMALTIVGCAKKCDICGGTNGVKEIFGQKVCSDCIGF